MLEEINRSNRSKRKQMKYIYYVKKGNYEREIVIEKQVLCASACLPWSPPSAALSWRSARCWRAASSSSDPAYSCALGCRLVGTRQSSAGGIDFLLIVCTFLCLRNLLYWRFASFLPSPASTWKVFDDLLIMLNMVDSFLSQTSRIFYRRPLIVSHNLLVPARRSSEIYTKEKH